jgi:hypothetical protein
VSVALSYGSPSPYLIVPLAMQTGRRVLYQLTTLASQDRRRLGQTGNTMATVLYPRIL